MGYCPSIGECINNFGVVLNKLQLHNMNESHKHKTEQKKIRFKCLCIV